VNFGASADYGTTIFSNHYFDDGSVLKDKSGVNHINGEFTRVVIIPGRFEMDDLNNNR